MLWAQNFRFVMDQSDRSTEFDGTPSNSVARDLLLQDRAIRKPTDCRFAICPGPGLLTSHRSHRNQNARLQSYCLTNSMGPSPLGGCGIGGHNKLPLVVRSFSGMLCPCAPMQSKRHCLVAQQHPEPNQLRGSTACHSCEWHAVSPLVHETTEPHSGS